MNSKKLITTTVAYIFLAIVNSHAQSVASNLTAVKKAIEKTNALYFKLFINKDATIVDLYTDDGQLLAPNEPPIIGKHALKKDFVDTFAAGNIQGVKFKTGKIYGNGKDYVTEEGNWQVFNRDGKLLDSGKYLKLWKATKTGWKIFRDLFNSDHKGK